MWKSTPSMILWGDQIFLSKQKRTRQDSNSQPLDPKSSALSIELLVHHHHNTIIVNHARYRVWALFVARLCSIGDERWYNCCNILISHHLHGSISLAVCSWDGFTGRSNILSCLRTIYAKATGT